uniref:Uncharacterized protein n=1 Tax=Kalanchoe fedtschenkoi TaxID=63787 RepID=A0A7N0URY0_KALFE
MGCTASKLDNEDTVRRCKDRRRLMKDAVYARHHLAAAQSDYCRSLRLTGSALSQFAAGEPLAVSDQTPPAVLLRNPSSFSAPKTFSADRYAHRAPSPSPPPSVRTPAPTAHQTFFPSPPSESVRSKTKPTHLRSASSVSSSSSLPHDRFKRRVGKPLPKLPHILSESSFTSSPRRTKSTNFRDNYYPTAAATYDSTPSQTSSVWNWENFYPPSPPSSEYFDRKERERLERENLERENLEREKSKYRNIHQSSEDEEEEAKKEGGEETDYLREEVHCSEWGDHYSTTSSSDADDAGGHLDDDDDEDDDIESRSEIESRSNFGTSVRSEFVGQRQNKYPAKSMKSEDDGVSSVSYGDMRIVVRHKNLVEIVAAIRENFDKAAEAGEKVSDMLEIGRAQLDKSFRQLKKTVYHSSGLFSNLSSSWTSKPPLAIKYRLDANALDEPGASKSLCSTLERLLAWEKKLYEEVKARETVKIEHERKLSTLQNQEYKGEDEVKLDKTKAAITRLQSLIIVTSQAVATTSTAITGLRDSDLVPQLVELCHGLMYMWRSMNQHHDIQNQIVQQVRGLVNQASKGDSTSDLHRQSTRELESAVSAWHSSFCRLVKFQRDFIQCLYGWFKLTLIPLNCDNVPPSGNNREHSEVFAFFDEWKLALERLPDTVASEAIKSFVNVVHVISVKQSEELKIKKRTETASRELERKASSLRSIEKKYYHSYSMVGLGLPDSGPNNHHVLDARDPLAEKKSELAICQRRVEDEMMRHSKAVELTRAMTLNNLQTGFPGVFQAMTSFSALFMEALEAVCTRSYAIK